MTRDTDPTVRLATRGRQLWADLTADAAPAPAERVLIEEACRLADRLDRLDGILSGRGREWLTFAERVNGDDGRVEVTVVVDRALSEVRQQQVALKALLGELRQTRAATGTVPAPRRGQGGQARASGTGARSIRQGGGGVLADLSARLAERRGQTAG